MGFFTNNNLYTSKQVGYNRQNSQALDNLLKDKRIAGIFEKPEEREELFRALKEKAQGGISRDEMRMILGKFRSGKGKNISEDEAITLANKVSPNSSDRYRYEKEKPVQNNNPQNGILKKNSIQLKKPNLVQNISSGSSQSKSSFRFF